jgi:RNA polymerase sigma-70 factor (ECF subfamily)
MSIFENAYKLWIETTSDIPRYFVSFKDVQETQQQIEISFTLFTELRRMSRELRNLRRWDERHVEYSEQSDESLESRAANRAKSLEDTVIDSERDERLHRAIAELPEIQRRRFVLYHEYGLTYEQIGQAEDCSAVAVKHSVDKAKTNIRKTLKIFLD